MQSVDDLHVRSITSGVESLSVHVVVDGASDVVVLGDIQRRLRRRFGIEHATIQVESGEFGECHSCDSESLPDAGLTGE